MPSSRDSTRLAGHLLPIGSPWHRYPHRLASPCRGQTRQTWMHLGCREIVHRISTSARERPQIEMPRAGAMEENGHQSTAVCSGSSPSMPRVSARHYLTGELSMQRSLSTYYASLAAATLSPERFENGHAGHWPHHNIADRSALRLKDSCVVNIVYDRLTQERSGLLINNRCVPQLALNGGEQILSCLR